MKSRIKEVIKEYGLTSKVVANRMGITPVGLSQHINGNPSVDVLQRIAGAIGCNISELFDKKSAAIVCPNCGENIRIMVQKE